MSLLTLADVPLKYRQTEDAATLAEAVALAPLVETSARAWLAEWLRDGIETAATPAELVAAWRRVCRYGHSVPREQLREAGLLRLAALAAEADQTLGRTAVAR